MTGYRNFIEAGESSFSRHGGKLAYRYLHKNGEEEALSFAALRDSAVALAARLQAVADRGDRVLIICGQSMDYVRALWGCLYSGTVAVPAYAPRNTHHFDRLRTIVESSGAKVVLLSSRQLSSVREIDGSGLLSSRQWIIVDDGAAAEGRATWVQPAIEPEDLALLQYTSGSTRSARGVMVSHHNLLSNQRMIERAYLHRPDTISVLWLPLFHDMGLMALLQGIYGGFSSHLMSPLDFLSSPYRWLEAISNLRATATAAPDFAYRLCLEKITDEQLAALDLSNLETAICGSEPISAKNLDAFAKRFGPCGFRREAFFPSYGLAEATLLVSGARVGDGPRLVGRRVGCGLAAEDCEVVIVDERGTRCSDGHVGEIWVKSSSVASGYWNDPVATRETFGAITADGAGPFLRTGDLGCLDGGEVVVTGRLHDLIIIRGANFYPNDIEETAAAAHPQLVAGGCAAFQTSEGALCVVAEVRKGSSLAGDPETAIVGAVSETYGVSVDRVLLVKQGTIPRTSSGKIQRSETRRALEENALRVVHGYAVAGAEDDGTARPEILGGFVLSLLSDQLKVPFYRLSRQKSLASLGLDSIALVHLKQRIEAELRVDLPTELFFADISVEQLTNEILRAWKSARPSSVPREQPILPGSFHATVGQTALWAMQQRAPLSTAYNQGFVARVEGPLDIAILEKSLQIVVARHPALRTTFRESNGRLWQDVAAVAAVHLEETSAADAVAAARAVVGEPFDLQRKTWRCQVIHGPDETCLSFVVHHIVFDMWSFGIFLDELTATYRALAANDPLPQPAVDHGAAWLDRARAQAEHASSEAGRAELEWWRNTLADAPATSRFPPSVSGRAASCEARRHRFVVPEPLLLELQQLAQSENLTLSHVLAAGFFLLLSKYSGQGDVILGIPLLGRTDADAFRAMGYFVNMAPVRVRGVDRTDVLGLMEETRRAIDQARSHQRIPFATLVEQCSQGRGEGWIRTIFSLLSSHLTGRHDLAPFILGMPGGRLQLGSAVLHSCADDPREAQFDTACTIIEWNGELHGSLDVRAGMYDENAIERLIDNYISLLRSMVRSRQSKTRSISVVGEKERVILRKHLRRHSPATADVSILERFRRAASQHAARIALTSPTTTRTYAELEHESERIALALVGRGFKKDDRVALAFSDRTTQTIAALAVLKVAGVFVPLDLAHPSQRLAYCVRDSGAAWILADNGSAARMQSIVGAHGTNVVRLDELAEHARASIPLPEPAAGDDVAYCIYTSGSTGVPKGVSVPHRGLRNLIEWHVNAFGVDPSARASVIAGPAFDVALWEVWPYLCTGATLVEPPAAVKTVAGDLARWIREQRVTHSFVPTPLAELLLEEQTEPDFGQLRYLFTAGDRLRVVARPDSSFVLINAYGPTENSVITTAGATVAGTESLPDIGQPIRNQDLYILDRDGNEVPIGVCGELYISGDGLAREYHRQPARTAERFLPNMFADKPGVRMYASGDLVRLAEDGRIHFVARNDDQVKIRGHRIELGEIEAVLMGHPAIRQCKVIVQESPAAGKWLAAYVSALTDRPESDAELRQWLEERLPTAMVPTAFSWMEALPVDANGKIDRKQLPPVAHPGVEERPLAPFAGRLEEEVAQLFAEVLGVARVGGNDDFFALGGHSLLAGKLAQLVHARFGVSIAMADVFAHPRIPDLAALLRAKCEAPARRPEPVPRPERIPLSSAQERLWFLQRLDPRSTDYNMSGIVHVRGTVDLAALQSAFQRLIAKHESLRTRFPEHEGTPYQEVLPSIVVPLECVTLEAADREVVRRTLRAWEAEPFSLRDGPLLRTRFLRTAPDEGWLFIGIHHIVADGRSLQILVGELSAPSSGPSLQYADYTLSCLTEEFREREATDLAYWTRHLARQSPKLSIPSLSPALNREESAPGDELRLALPAALSDSVHRHAMEWKTTEFAVYLTALAVLLSRTTGEERLLIGTPYEGRNGSEWQGVVGFFANVLPILVDVTPRSEFRELLDIVQRRSAEAIEHSGVSYDKIVRALRQGDASDSDLIQVMFDFEQFTPAQIDLGPEARADVVPTVDTSAKYDLTFRVRLATGEPAITLNYRREKYGRQLVESLLSSYLVLLAQIVRNHESRLCDLRLVDDEAAARLLRQGTARERALPAASIVQRLEAVARANPTVVALVSDDGEKFTYEVLHATANRLAHMLRDAGVSQHDACAVCLDPGPAFVISALAILKLGAAYVPIDPRYPAKRRRAILDDCGAAVVITDDDGELGAVRSLSFSALRLEQYPATNLEVPIAKDHAAYIVYTSGTTGAPKGVVVPQRALANLCQWHAHAYGLEGRGERIRAGQTAGIGFDAAVWEIWPYLLEAASVWFAPASARTSSLEMTQWLTERRITHVFLSTPLAHEVLGEAWLGSLDLEVLLTGGDRLTTRPPADATYRLVNHYGPSENAVVTTACLVTPEGTRLPPIGRPIDNVQALVLDSHDQLLPAGVAGELHLAGRSLASGYRNDPHSTREKWIPHPFAADGTHMYRTGDRVCWNDDGELEYLGRVDDQMKIRGFRIEPGEIVQALTAHPDVRSAFVRSVEHPVTGLHLAAYVVLRPGATSDADELKNELAAALPAFMTPRFLIVLDAFPLTSNGKVDAGRLPLPAWNDGSLDRPLATATEQAIGAIWSGLLGAPVNNAHANFFALGGHSLLAARAVAAIEDELGRDCTLQTFVASATLAELAEKVDTGEEYRRIPRVRKGQQIPLSPLQRRLWLIQQFAGTNADYNVVGAIELKGVIDRPSLRRAVCLLIERHAVLRTRIVTIDGTPYQDVLAADGLSLDGVFIWEDHPASSPREQDACVAARIASLTREAYDLERGPLFRLHALRFDDSTVVLVVSIHHIVVDGWSVRVLLRDLFEIYGRCVAGREPVLPRLPVEYTDYSVWAAQRLCATQQDLLAFWKDYVRDRPAVLLPGGRQRETATGAGATKSLSLGVDTSTRLRALARELRASLFDLLFAAHVVWLYQLTRSTDLTIGAPFHQRGRAELENVAGFFVNVLPVRSRFSRTCSFKDVLGRVRQNLAAVQAHQELPFDLIAEHAAFGESLYETMFDLRQEIPFEATFDNLSVRTVAAHVDAPIAALAVTVAESDSGLTWSCTFRPERFSPDMIESWGENFRVLVNAVVEDVDRPIRDLPLRRVQLERLPSPQGPSDETLLVQLARQVATAPARPALTTDGETFTYLDLELTSNQVAHYLKAQGIRPGDVVAIEARHAVDSILIIIGVMKLGASYVPIDITLPRARVLDLLADCGCRHVLMTGDVTLAGFRGQVVSMQRERWRESPRHLLGIPVTPDCAAYLAYTSGTTGEPKASVLSQHGISNYVSTIRERFRITPEDRFLLFAPLSFDASLEEIFVTLASGASLHIGPPDSKASLPALVELCREAAVTVLILPTAYWHLLVEHLALAGAGVLPTVRLVSVGGEKAALSTVQRWTEVTEGRIELWNIYGPSECSVGCVVDRLDGELHEGRDFIPLRHPVANVEVHVLDEHLDPVPTGVDGEVYVAGVGLAHGYHRRPALTAEKFVPNPFGKPGSRLYRSGDLVRLDPSGGLEFLGRSDFQVKIDGIRVEPGEVESCLERHPAVEKAVVIPKLVGTTGNHLVGYVTAAGATADELHGYLRGQLPPHLVPTTLHLLDAFPLTANQKIDRSALEALGAGPREHPRPETDTEKLLLDILCELMPSAVFGTTDDLFALGAGSLLLMRLITKIEVQANVRLAVRDIFDHPTIRELAQLVDEREARAERMSSIARTDRTEIPLSGAQARLWYLQQIDKQSSAYNVPNCLRLQGRLDRQALLAAIRATVAESESLRTVFQVRGEAPMQIVCDDMDVDLVEHDFGDHPIDAALSRTVGLGRTLLERPFDLEDGPLCRFHLVRLAPDEHVLISIFHHIVVDGWSIQLWNERLASVYSDGPSRPAEGALQYRDFSEWQRVRLENGERERQLRHWDKVLAGELPSLELPLDFARPAQPSDRGDVRPFRIDDLLAHRLSSLAQERQASLFMVLLSAYVALLHRYCHQDDLLVGIAAHGRERPELHDVIGFFVSTLVVRCSVRPNLSFTELLEDVKNACLDAFDHQDVPLEEVAARVNALRRGGRSEIFQTIFSFHEGERTGAEGFRDLRVCNFDFPHRTAKFDLSLAMWTTAEGLMGCVEFRTELFAPETIEALVGHFQNLLRDMVTRPCASVAELQLLAEAEHHALVHAHDGAVLPLPDALPHQLIEQQVVAHPDRIAVTFGSEQLTYAELNRRANVVAHELLAHGAQFEDRVVLLLGRDASYLVALLACLKSGTAFVPMDPAYPVQKQVSMIRHSAARFVISDARHRERIDGLDLRLPLLDLDDVLADRNGRDANPNLPLTGKSLAYVIHTSGSTGTPKGAMIEHRGMLNHLLDKVHGLGLTEEDVVAEIATTMFDVSIWQYLVALTVGGRTAIIPGDSAWLPRELLAELEREGVTVFESVPSHMKVILDELEASPRGHLLPRLRVYVSNAEALTPALCHRWMRRLPHVSVINTYGATECSDDTSHLTIDTPPSNELPYLPIHGTLPNLTTYVLDELMQPVPVGVSGEVYIGGVGVGRGYADDPLRTAMSFVPDPFASEPGQRLYKTGDIARLDRNGAIEFLGRADFQVKIRGQRVELGEIEATLRMHENVRDVLVSAARAQHGGLHLVAYVVPARHPAPAAQELQAFMRARLADHMVPSAVVFLDEFPLSDNGKIDRQNLLPVSDEELLHRTPHVSPATDTERELARLWTSVLQIEEVGALDGFFEVGGHSLLAAELMIKIRNRFGVEVLLREFFDHATVRGLAALVDARRVVRSTSPAPGLERYPAQPQYDLAPCQIPEWYAYQFDPASPVYNVCVCDLFLYGDVDRGAFLRAWQTILDRHDVLHVRFGYRDGKPFQTVDQRVVLRQDDVFRERLDLEGDAEVLAEANRLAAELGAAPFDFAAGPLFRIRLITYGSNRHQLIFVVHHIIWDETSLINLTGELSELYNAFVDNREPSVPELRASYFDYVQWMHESLASGRLEASERYWLDLYRTVPPPLDLPTDYPRPDLMSYRGDAIETWLPRRIVQKLDSFIRRNGVTLFMVELALLDHYIHLLTGQDDFVIGCPIAGRVHPDFKPLLGLFATPLPIRCNTEPDMTFRQLLQQVSSRTLDAFDHSQYPSTQLIERLSHVKDLSRPKLFSVMFGLQNDKTDVVGRLSFRHLEVKFEDVADTENKTSRFDLNFVVDQFGSDIKFSCIYNTDLFHRETVALVLENMTALLDVVLDDPDKPLHGYGALIAGTHDVEAGPVVGVDATATMHGGLERQAARTPDRTALRIGDECCSYGELNARANKLARYMLSMGIGSGQPIVVLQEPSIDMIVSLYAVLKSRCCFVPIAVDTPQARLDAILRETNARAVLTSAAFEARFSNCAADLILVDGLAEVLACFLADDLPPVDPASLAYILFTSGTTGQPRGIEIEHRGVANMLAGVQHEYALNERDRMLFHTPYTFDVAVQEIFWPLAFGATVVIAPRNLLKAAREIASLIERHSVTFAQFVPAMLEALVAARRKGVISCLPSLRQVICGGAVLSKALNDGFREMFSAPLANHYGPTEVTVDAARFDCRQPFVGDSTPIGRPIANTTIFVLDAEGERVPRGIIGEIHIASPGLARGYLNDPTRTAQAFVDLELDASRRVYKTGDLGSYDGRGLLHFHGRRDRQIKVRGNRVETDEIVGVLASHPNIAAAAVRYLKEDTLIAYVEQDPTIHRVESQSGVRYTFTFEQRPELIPAVETEFVESARLTDEFPGLQFVMVTEAGEIDLVGHAVPLRLGPAETGLDWSEALRRASDQRSEGLEPNASYAFVRHDAPPVLLDGHRMLAKAHGFERVVYADRERGVLLVEELSTAERRPLLTRANVREFLRQSLPCYMIPELVHFVTAIPRTESGKVDEKRLPDVELRAAVEHKAPETDTQKGIAILVKQVLGLASDIGIKDDFFVLGGQSLKAVELISEVNDKYGCHVDLREFYREPTVESLERLVARTSCTYSA